ncbi:regulator of G-protein signaling 22 [Gadus morhua]|uniref:Regulator of G protein signaling 22 n=1 Tax=Gadus morhua TaxID=8049 RepID=A0A8C4ZHU0_GADMO|nr:regulator of G-protein signaling 22 [Gadus morhua]
MPISGQIIRLFVRSRICGQVATDPPFITADNVEHYLATDDTLVHFFNDFLSLPSFPVALSYNQDSGLFEVETGAAELVSRRISSVLQGRKSSGLSEDQALLAFSGSFSGSLVDNHYTVHFLDKMQGLPWIIAERLPLFVQSDCYFEYRLAKLLSQWEPGPRVRKMDDHSFRGSLSDPRPPTSRGEEPMHRCLSTPPASHDYGPDEVGGPKTPSTLPSLFTSPLTHDDLPADQTLSAQRPDRILYLEDFSRLSCSEPRPQGPGAPKSLVLPLQYMAASVCSRNFITTGIQMEEKMDGVPGRRDLILEEGEEDEEQEVEEEIVVEEDEEDKENMEEGYEDLAKKNVFDICCQGARLHGGRQGLDEFKEFLRDTPGERVFHLWMDIERLTSTQHWERKDRHLVLMRSRYMQSSSQCSLNAELLFRLGLTTPPCWTEEKLRQVQPRLTEALLCYWAPRFWMSQWTQEDGEGPAALPGPCAERECFPSTSMERMLQALHADSHAGLYFTHFCEDSGNQLWENAVHFWSDLQRYHQLFYQDSLDPYTVQRQAQHLFSRFLSGSAWASVGVAEDQRLGVYECLRPAFEELFDQVEEHILDLLLEPWTLLVTRDTLSYQTVCVQEKVRQLDNAEFRELQVLHEETQLRLREQARPPSSPCPTPPPSAGPPMQPNPWAKVLPRYRGYRLGSLLRSSREIQHFTSFLEQREASIHLRCWLDLEQYRRTSHRDKATREWRSSEIADKYLNRKYFLGPDSPATAVQQNEILHRAGGQERLKRECLSDTLVGEIQAIVRTHIEQTWLPLFLATEEFIERQNDKLQAAAGPSERDNHKKKRASRKSSSGLWMSSSKEILVLRRVLLSPTSCGHFRRFAALHGDFLENDVLFWLEVQKYKDLCHSHSDEATIQRKVSNIISCFISSSVPPALQIDIPPGQACSILEMRKTLGPYIFREAQMSVFSELLKLWPDFQALRSSVREEKLLSVLEEQEQKHRASLQRRRRRQAKLEQKNAQERQPSSTEEEEEEPEQEEEEDDVEEEDDKSDGDKEDRLTDLSQALQFPTQQLSWSYSKYMRALKRTEEELQPRRKGQQENTSRSTTASDSSSSRSSIDSLVSRRSPKHSSRSSLQLRTERVSGSPHAGPCS